MRDPDRIEGVRLVTDRHPSMVAEVLGGHRKRIAELEAENADLRRRLNALIDVEEDALCSRCTAENRVECGSGTCDR